MMCLFRFPIIKVLRYSDDDQHIAKDNARAITFLDTVFFRALSLSGFATLREHNTSLELVYNMSLKGNVKAKAFFDTVFFRALSLSGFATLRENINRNEQVLFRAHNIKESNYPTFQPLQQ